MATKQDRGTKRSCQSCSERFYDLNHSPITCPLCGAPYVIASSPAALAAFQAEEKAAKRVKKPVFAEEAEAPGELPAVEGEEALADVEAEETAAGEADEAFLEDEEEEGGDMSNIIGGPAEGEEDR